MIKLFASFNWTRLQFSSQYAARHLIISLTAALASATLVFGLWYTAPYRQLLNVSHIFGLLLAVDVVCGPLLTLILTSPQKSRRERWLDFSLVGLVQLVALVYGLHSMWIARPVALAFEVDRLIIVAANELQTEALPHAPPSLQHLPWAGVLRLGTRTAANETEQIEGAMLGLAGVSPALRPDWWLPWSDTLPALRIRALPLAELMARRPQDANTLHAAARLTGFAIEELHYLPLVTSKTLDWVALLDPAMNMVGWAAVDGF